MLLQAQKRLRPIHPPGTAERAKEQAQKKIEHFPCGEPATAGSFTIEGDDFENLDGPRGRAARLVRLLGLDKFCWETQLSRQTARRISKGGFSPRSRGWLAVIACLKKHRG